MRRRLSAHPGPPFADHQRGGREGLPERGGKRPARGPQRRRGDGFRSTQPRHRHGREGDDPDRRARGRGLGYPSRARTLPQTARAVQGPRRGRGVRRQAALRAVQEDQERDMTEPASDGGKVAVISGGSRGLGRVLVERLLHDGWRVATFSRSANEFVTETSEAAGKDFFWQSADLTELET